MAEPANASDILPDIMPVVHHGRDIQTERELLPPQPPQLSEGIGHGLGASTDTLPTQQSVHSAFPMFDSTSFGLSGSNSLDLFGAATGASPTGASFLSDPLMFDSFPWPWHHEASFLLGPEPMDTSVGDQTSATIQPHQSREPEHLQPSVDVDEVVQPLSAVSQTLGNYDQPSSASVEGSNVGTRMEQTQVLDEIMQFALSIRSDSSNSHEFLPSWCALSSKVSKAFNVDENPQGNGTPFLEHCVRLFFRYFEPLWPMFSPQNLVINRLHPLLYLVLTSIGAMYGDHESINVGNQIHARLQACLVEPLELRDPDYDAPWLAQSRCHLRIAALYFGQPRAISHAHHLGILLAAQARRMELFSATYTRTSMEKFRNLDGPLSNQERLTIWLRVESRRRLAFGIYRSEAYTSLLLQSRPLVYLGEIDLAFPSCDAVWNGEKMPASVCIRLIENDRTPGRELYASDIYHIALDGEEALPPMDPLGYELLALGLLWPTWEYSRNPTRLSRLCGENLSVPDDPGVLSSTGSSVSLPVGPQSRRSDATHRLYETHDYDHLDTISRKMLELQSGYKRLLLALRKWEQSLPLVKSLARTQRDRTLLMSGLIVYHLVHLRLSAPTTDLHELQYRLIDGRPPDPTSLQSIYQWLRSPRPRFAAERAVSIWSLIANECAKAEHERARFNLVAFTGLHEAAVLLWAYASTVPGNDTGSAAGAPLMLRARNSPSNYLIHRDSTADILDSFGSLLDGLNQGKSSSFAQATKGLMGIPFPPEARPIAA